jgi:hypothetical protein
MLQNYLSNEVVMKALDKINNRKPSHSTINIWYPAIILLTFFLTSCATPTGYTNANSPWTSSYGYKDKRIDANEFSISVIGNPHTGSERAAEIALLRAAYLTKEEGSTHFTIITQKNKDMKTATLSSIPIMFGSTLVFIPVDEHSTMEPTAILLIHILPVQLAPPPDAVNANDVIERLRKHFE